MKKYLIFPVVLLAIFVVLSFSGCAHCVKSHEVPYTRYRSHCVSYRTNGTCSFSMPVQESGYDTVCDEWKEDK